MTKPRSIIIADRGLQAAIAQRGDAFNAAGNEILERYVRLCESKRAEIRRLFSDRELQALLDACNGTIHDPIDVGIAGFASHIGDAIELDDLAGKWGLDGLTLVSKLEMIDGVTTLALIDFIERAWRHADDDRWFRTPGEMI